MDNTRQKILLVDDEPLNINVLVDILKPDYHVVVAKSGKDALRRATSAPQPDLILLDIIMPEMDGYEVCKALKEDPLTNSIPVIFITAMSDAEDEEKGFQLGAVDYITKPFSASTVKARAKTHLTLYRQNQSLIELNAIKNRFLAIASHDLRNPVSAIMGFCELLLNEGGIECLSEDQRDTVEYISLASAELLNLLNSLLDISAIESGKFPVVFRTGSLLQLIERRIKHIRHYTEKKGIAIREDLTDVPEALFDPDRINQAIDNLLNNAIKFSPPGTTIHVTLSRDDKHAVIKIRDEGPGIPPEKQGQLFGEFNTLGTKTTDGEKSTGFGLFIVKKIVDAHGGTINIKSAPGQGAEFTFTVALSEGLNRQK